MYSDELVDKAKEIEIGNNSITFNLDEDRKEVLELFIRDCIRWKRFDYLKRIKNKDALLDIIIKLIEIRDREILLVILTESEEIKSIFNKEQVDKIVEAISKNIEFAKGVLETLYIKPIIKIYKDYNLDEKAIRDVIDLLLNRELSPFSKIAFYMNGFLYNLSVLVDNNLFLDLVREKLNDRHSFENILETLANAWKIIERMRKIYRAKEEIEFIGYLWKLKNFLTDENYEKIMNFFMSRNAEKLIKRRIKKEEHHEYIKYVLEFLPKEIADKYNNYILISHI